MKVTDSETTGTVPIYLLHMHFKGCTPKRLIENGIPMRIKKIAALMKSSYEFYHVPQRERGVADWQLSGSEFFLFSTTTTATTTFVELVFAFVFTVAIHFIFFESAN